MAYVIYVQFAYQLHIESPSVVVHCTLKIRQIPTPCAGQHRAAAVRVSIDGRLALVQRGLRCVNRKQLHMVPGGTGGQVRGLFRRIVYDSPRLGRRQACTRGAHP